jgi:hypothetical protein
MVLKTEASIGNVFYMYSIGNVTGYQLARPSVPEQGR